jgi:ribosomal-protein-alanine N-acetyltransferase
VIRHFKNEDLKSVYDIEKKIFLDPWEKSMFLMVHCEEESIFLVAVINEKVVGYIIASTKKIIGLNSKKNGHLMNLAVEEEWREKGIATALLKNVIKHLLKKKIKSLKLEVRISNFKAQRFYESHGFKKEVIINDYYLNSEDALIYKKTLKT